MKNPIVKKRTAKDFIWMEWTPAQLKKNVKDALQSHKDEIEKLKALSTEEQTFENIIEKIEVLDGDFRATQGPVEYIWYVHPRKTMRDAAQEASNLMDKEGIDLNNDQVFLSVINTALKSVNVKELDTPTKRLHESYVRGLKHSGFYLEKMDQKRLNTIRKKLVKIVSDFSATINNWDAGIYVTKEDVKDFPETYVKQLSFDKKKKKYKVSLDYPQLVPFMRICPDESLRKEMTELVGKKGGEKNLKRMQEIVTLKTEVANLLGYDTYADLNLVDKMAKKTETVKKFIEKNIEKYHPKGQSDLDILRYAKEQSGNKKKFAGHDVSYYTDRVQEELFAIDSEKLREYFTLERVTEVMLEHFGKFFGITYVEKKIPVFHESIRLFEVTDTRTKDIVGYFSMDMYPREGKYGHACMMDVFQSYEKDNRMIAPFASLIMNLPVPTKQTPSLLDMREIETVFHEFGHVMHGVLGKAKYTSQSGTNVARDFVEVPSQLFEEWVFEERLLKKMGKHYITGKTIPQDLIQSVVAARTFQEGYFLLRQFVFAEIDIDIYTNPKKVKSMNKVYKDAFKKYILPISSSCLQPASFTHITSGYSAGYYSYMWSLELSKKFYKYIKKEGSFSPRVGKKLRKEVLEKGRTEDANILVKNFLKK